MAVANLDSKSWLEVEAKLEAKERELLEKEGIIVPEGHLDGYKYRPKRVFAEKHKWDCAATPNQYPKCKSDNWSHSDVNFEIGQGIAYITLNRPASNNALNDTISQGLHDAVFELQHRLDVRIVVLRAEGKMFCAGGDPKSFSDAVAMTDADNRKASISFMKFLNFLSGLPQFVVGLVQGSTMGSGIGLLCACDMVIAVNSARFTVSEVKLGTAPVTIAPFLVGKVGPTVAKRMLCTAENMSAEAAKHAGLIQQIVEDEMDFSNAVAGICEKLTLCAPIATSRSKKLVTNVAQRPLSTQLLDYTGQELSTIRVGHEAVIGMVAIQAKTKPAWAEVPIKPLY